MMLEVVIPCSTLVPQSVDERIRTLNFAIANFYGKQIGVQVKLIVVEQVLRGNKPHLIPRIKVPGYSNVQIQPVVIRYPTFCKPWCINVGEQHVEGDYFLLAETDMYCPQSYFGNLMQWFEAKELGWAFAWNRLCYTGEAEKNLMMGGRRLNGVQRWTRPTKGYSEGGLVLFTRKLWAGLGGACEYFLTLGGIDNELAWRANKRSGTYARFPMEVYHMYHQGIKKSTRPERVENIKKLRQVRKWPGKVNKFLKQYGQGDPEAPLCAKVEWPW